MKQILKDISEKAILLGDFEFTKEQVENQWLGYAPASFESIKNTDERLGLKLPDDYKQLLEITNGFPQFNTIVASLMPIEQIDYLKVLIPHIIEAWSFQPDLQEATDKLAASILIGGLNEEQQVMLIPPNTNDGKWGYWTFAAWAPGETRFESLETLLKSELDFMKSQLSK